MKTYLRFSLLALLSVTSIPAFSQSVYKYEVEKVQDDIYVLKPVINDYRWVTSNIILIVNEREALVVDSGLLPAAATEAIKEIKKITTKPVKYLVNTHWHGDHWQGNDAFEKTYPGLEIIATEQGLKGMQANGMVWAKQLYLKYFQNFYLSKYEKALTEKSLDGKTLSDAELLTLKEGTEQLRQDIESMKQLKPVLPNTSYSDKMILKRGNREIQLLYLGIGNTSGDAVVYLPNEKVVVAGDLVVYPSPYESGMFSPEWLETSQKLAALDYKTLIPGHGDVQRDQLYLNFLNALYNEIISQVNNAYLNGTTGVDDFKKVVTHETVTSTLNKKPEYEKFTKNLDPAFVPAAIQTSFRRIMQGKK
jgi:glyoxylase-like metal-dependent hydrolase (beta-lactamase superfamily II)